MEKENGYDVEAGEGPGAIPHMKMIFDQAVLTPAIINESYPGSGTEEDPYIVNWIHNDPRNPMLFSLRKKWALTMLVAMATLAVAFVSSAYSGGVEEIIIQFHVGSEVVTLGISLFVLGFAIGPLLWAPMSELYGRQYLFIGTYAMLTFFNAGAAGSQNIQTLLILRFFAGAFGSSPLTNAGGVIADMFSAKERGLATSIFAAAPFMGPVLGPIVGGFVGETIGWRWIEGIMAIFTGVLWLMGWLLIPETYPPVLLRKRAEALSKLSGKVYISQGEADQGKISKGHAFKTAISRPWILLFKEPIVLLLSIYMAIIYGTLYMMFGAFPIVYQESRGWTQGIGGLAFLGVAVGMMGAVLYSIYDNKRYINVEKNDPSGFAPPEARLPPAMIGGVAIPIGLFWFAWTNYPSIHWIVSIIAGAPFGFGMVLVFLSIMNYLIDAYVIFAASVLAANSVLRSLFGAIFPLFTSYMYQGLGIHWASSIPAFLALACVPFPFLFYKYGLPIRQRCKYAAEADAFIKRMRGQLQEQSKDEESSSLSDEEEKGSTSQDPEAKEKSRLEKEVQKAEEARLTLEREEAEEQEAIDYSYDDPDTRASRSQRSPSRPGWEEIKVGPNDPQSLGLHKIRTATSVRSTKSLTTYESNPFDIDRVNTREYFRPSTSRKNTATSISAVQNPRSSQSG